MRARDPVEPPASPPTQPPTEPGTPDGARRPELHLFETYAVTPDAESEPWTHLIEAASFEEALATWNREVGPADHASRDENWVARPRDEAWFDAAVRRCRHPGPHMALHRLQPSGKPGLLEWADLPVAYASIEVVEPQDDG